MNTDNTFKHVDLSYMELMADGDADMKQTMLEMLVDELPTEVEKIKKLSVERNFKDLKAVAHKLKSTLAFVGNQQLDAANKDVEKIAKGEMPEDELENLVQFMVKESELVVSELRGLSNS